MKKVGFFFFNLIKIEYLGFTREQLMNHFIFFPISNIIHFPTENGSIENKVNYIPSCCNKVSLLKTARRRKPFWHMKNGEGFLQDLKAENSRAVLQTPALFTPGEAGSRAQSPVEDAAAPSLRLV